MAAQGLEPPHIVEAITGPASQAALARLSALENPAIAKRRRHRKELSGDSHGPVVWTRAQGANVWDVDGNRLVDLCAGFGVAAVGHAHPNVVAAGQEQLARMPHAMGDAFPADRKAQLIDKLAELLPGDLRGITLGCSGSDAVEAALKSAVLATGRSNFISFDAGYHGLSLGALRVSGYRPTFRAPFAGLLSEHDLKLPWPLTGDGASELEDVERGLREGQQKGRPIAAIVVEPLLGRGGNYVPPKGFLQGLKERAHSAGALLIIDEVFTGFGRTGHWFACQYEGVEPDIICVGKAMSGGYPISACAGRPQVMAAWGECTGEAIHTSTFLGNPVGCAMALACIEAIESEHMVQRAADLGTYLGQRLDELHRSAPEHFGPARGRGLMQAIEIRRQGEPSTPATLQMMRKMLEAGFIILPCGSASDALQFTPPMIITTELLDLAVSTMAGVAGGS